MKKPVIITLAEREFTIRPLTLGTIRDIDLARTTDVPTSVREREAFYFDLYVEVIGHALKEDHPEMTTAAILGLRTNLDELIEAYAIIMRLSGLLMDPPPQGATAEV